MQPAESDRSTSAEAAVTRLVRGNTTFALDLYRILCGADGNLFFSPYSITTALAMTYAGARGDTAAQMAHALHFTLPMEELHPAFAQLAEKIAHAQASGDIQLAVANALWPQDGYPLLEPFLTATEANYGSALNPVDYHAPEAARASINRWVEVQTQQRIQELIPPGVLNELTRLVLTNAIYFKGQWASQFDPARTEAAPFFVTADAAVTVPMMAQKQAFGYAEADELQIVELPYAGDELAMVLVVPRQVDGLAALEQALNADQLAAWLGHLRRNEVQLFLPRFTVSQGLRLDHALRSLGMTDAFDMQRADFSGMDGRAHWLYIAAAIHKAFVAVDEEGTEAAAATAVVVAMRALPKPPPVVRADHPFLFLIRDRRTESILFIGRVIDPLAED